MLRNTSAGASHSHGRSSARALPRASRSPPSTSVTYPTSAAGTPITATAARTSRSVIATPGVGHQREEREGEGGRWGEWGRSFLLLPAPALPLSGDA